MWNTVSLNPWRNQIGWDRLFRSHCATKLKGKAFGAVPGQLRLVGRGWLRGHQTVRAGRRCACWHSGLEMALGVVFEREGKGKAWPVQGTSRIVDNNLCDGELPGWNEQRGLSSSLCPRQLKLCMDPCWELGCESCSGWWKRRSAVCPFRAGWSCP